MSLPLTMYLVLVVAVALQRLKELRIAAENTNLMMCLGAEEVAPNHYDAMRLLHGTWLISCVIEAIYRGVMPSLWVVCFAVCALGVGQVLRIAAMRALGPRWTTRILVLRGLPPITGGIYRWVRHPNYLGVILEIAALPLIFGCVFTAFFFSIANLVLLLAVRIPAEEAALVRVNDYARHFGPRGRVVSQRSQR